MTDYVIFLKDVFFAEEQKIAVFKEGQEYEILDENNNFLFVQSKPNTNECSQIPKSDAGILFKYKK